MATLTQQVATLTQQVAALTDLTKAILVAGAPAPKVKAPRVETAAQVMFRTRSAGTCPSCGRKDFHTPNGGLTHVLAPDHSTPCLRTAERDVAFLPAAK